MQWLVIVLVLLACKKKPEEEAPPEPAPSGAPQVGHSVTKLKDPDAEPPEKPEKPEKPEGSAEEPPADAARKTFGGDGTPAHRDKDGRVRGPGGPVFMGRGQDCTDEVDHCLRKDVWFACNAVESGRMYRATPAFELEGKWYSFRDQEVEPGVLLKTKVATSAELMVGSPIVWLIEESPTKKWVKSEHDALTSSRWECGVIESVGGTHFKVSGWVRGIAVETARVVVERKSH